MDLQSKLANLISLSSNVRMFVPSTCDVDQEVDTTAHVARIQGRFSELFGGATTYKAVGCWKSPTAGLVTEKVTIVESHCTEQALGEGIDSVLELARTLRTELSQDAVAIEVNGKLYLI